MRETWARQTRRSRERAGSGARPRRRGSRLVRWLLLVEVATVLITVLIAGGVSAWNTRALVEESAADRVLGIARALAAGPGTTEAVAARDTRVLQPVAAATLTGTGVSFVTIMDPAGTRFTHPDPAQIGRTYRGTFAPAAAGGTVVETFPGTLGVSVRAVVPLLRDDGVVGGGRVVGMVAVGILSVDVAGEVTRQLTVLALGALVAIGMGLGLAVVAARRVRRDTLGLDPREITALHGHHEAVLHAMREGLLVVEDATGHVAVLNDEAARLLGLPASAVPATRRDRGPDPTLAGLGVEEHLRARLADPGAVTDETHLVGERVLLVNRTRVVVGTTASSVVTLRDRTEVDTTLRALDDARSTAGALRFQAHEHANRLQAVATLVELGAHDDARDLAVRWGRDVAGIGDEVRDRVDDPALAALLVDKATDARDRGLEIRLGPATGLSVADGYADTGLSTDLVTVLGNLVDNALDAAGESTGRGIVEVELVGDGGAVTVRVGDDGPGLPDVETVFTAGWSTKGGGTGTTDGAGRRRGLGLALVRRVVERRDGTVSVGPGIGEPGASPGTTFTVTLRVM